MKVWLMLLYVLPTLVVMAQHARTNLEETVGSDTSAARADLKRRRESPSQELPDEQLPDLDLLSQPVQVMQPVESSAESIALQLQPMSPAEEPRLGHTARPVTEPAAKKAEQPMAGDAVRGFCCYYSSDPNNHCGNCQAKDSRAWNADPSNCASSGGSYCSGVVGLFGIDKEVPAINKQIEPPVLVPLPKMFRVFGWGAGCGFASVMVALALVCRRHPWHDYTLVSSSDHLLLVSEAQDQYGDSAA